MCTQRPTWRFIAQQSCQFYFDVRKLQYVNQLSFCQALSLHCQTFHQLQFYVKSQLCLPLVVDIITVHIPAIRGLRRIHLKKTTGDCSNIICYSCPCWNWHFLRWLKTWSYYLREVTQQQTLKLNPSGIQSLVCPDRQCCEPTGPKQHSQPKPWVWEWAADKRRPVKNKSWVYPLELPVYQSSPKCIAKQQYYSKSDLT